MPFSGVEAWERISMLRMATFSIEARLFGLGSLYIHDILPVPKMMRVPQNASQYFDRVMQLADKRFVHVINLEKLLGLANGPPDDPSRLLVLKSDDFGMGMLSDMTPQMLDIDEAEITDVLPVSPVLWEFLHGVVPEDGNVIVLLDARAIIDTLAAKP